MPRVGHDLFEMLVDHASVGGIAEDKALELTVPILDALRHLHELGFAHRDIKSENILVNYDRNVDNPRHPYVDQVYLIGNVYKPRLSCCSPFRQLAIMKHFQLVQILT